MTTSAVCAKEHSQSRLHFTGKERDTESGNDYFGARYYASSMERFLSPDPVFISAQRLMDPQSLNLYSYVRNNPLGLTDDSGLDFYLACQTSDHSGCGQVQNGSSSVWVQGQGSGKDFVAFDVDMNKQGDPSVGYSDQFGNQYSGTFDQNGGVSFTNTATGASFSNSIFIDGSDQTNVNGSGMFAGIQGRFNSDCGGSCEAKGSLYDLSPGAVSALEKQIGASLEDKLNFFGGHGKSISYRFGDDQLTHIVNHLAGPDAGRQEVHFEGHPPGRDLVNFVLHQVDAIRDKANGQAGQEPRLP